MILSIIAPLLASIIQLAVSRQREYLADASAVELTRNPSGLISALKKLTADTAELKGASRGCSTSTIVNPLLKKKRGRTASSAPIRPFVPDRAPGGTHGSVRLTVERHHFLVEGRVQGVGFRHWTARTALSLGLTGWVRNLPDGSVEVQAQGKGNPLREWRTGCGGDRLPPGSHD